jgi:hypothetical protein
MTEHEILAIRVGPALHEEDGVPRHPRGNIAHARLRRYARRDDEKRE